MLQEEVEKTWIKRAPIASCAPSDAGSGRTIHVQLVTISIMLLCAASK